MSEVSIPVLISWSNKVSMRRSHLMKNLRMEGDNHVDFFRKAVQARSKEEGCHSGRVSTKDTFDLPNILA